MKLVIESDEGRRREVPLDRDEITIGRREDNLVHLPERNVSRHHARLVRRDGRLLLEDLRSANGTRVNGVRITEAVPLGEADLVQIGDYGVALRPDEVPLDVPLVPVTTPEPPPVGRVDVLADTAPHPLVLGSTESRTSLPEELSLPARRSRLALGVVILGLFLGLGAAMVLRMKGSESSHPHVAVCRPDCRRGP